MVNESEMERWEGDMWVCGHWTFLPERPAMNFEHAPRLQDSGDSEQTVTTLLVEGDATYSTSAASPQLRDSGIGLDDSEKILTPVLVEGDESYCPSVRTPRPPHSGIGVDDSEHIRATVFVEGDENHCPVQAPRLKDSGGLGEQVLATAFIGGDDCPFEEFSGVFCESRSPLPNWYPRKPLQDITDILNSGLIRRQADKKKGGPKAFTAGSISVFPLTVVNDIFPSRKKDARMPVQTSSAAWKRSTSLRKGFR